MNPIPIRVCSEHKEIGECYQCEVRRLSAELVSARNDISRLRGALELFVNEAVTPDGCGGYFWTDARIVDAIEAAKDALKSPLHSAPTEGEADR
jgi:hypothetical protein